MELSPRREEQPREGCWSYDALPTLAGNFIRMNRSGCGEGRLGSRFDQIQGSLQFQFQFRALRQVQFLPSTGLEQVGFERSKCRAFPCLFLVLISHALERP